MAKATLVLLMALASVTVGGRPLNGRSVHAVSTATSYSNGGTATAVSKFSGDAYVGTTAVSTNGGDATAVQSADSGDHAQVTVANDNEVTTTTVHQEHTWISSPACQAAPAADNSQKDDNGRLWGYEGGVSCTYKDPKDHHPLFYWEAAPVCQGTAGTSTADSEGRMWGWANGASCAYRSTRRTLYAATASRKLLAVAKAVASSNGGQASSTSQAAGSAEVDTTTVAAKGGEAVASQSADKGKHSQVTAAVGNSTATIIKKDDKSFEEAPACTGNATDDATTDALGNKWGWENDTSCAYKPVKVAPEDKWDETPACPPKTNVTKIDSSKRMWGWAKDANGTGYTCAVKGSWQGNDRRRLQSLDTVAGAVGQAASTATGGQAVAQAVSQAFVPVTAQAQVLSQAPTEGNGIAQAAATSTPQAQSARRKLYAATTIRKILAVAKAVSSSNGGQASSTSQAAGSAEVDTTTVAAKGGEAVASQSADKGKHSQVTAAVGNSTATIIKKDDKSFEEAPACTGNATDDATTDALGNKWGWEDNTSCAYKPVKVAPEDKWDQTPACPPKTNVTKIDSSKRMWGWAKDANGTGYTCAVKGSWQGNDRRRLQDTENPTEQADNIPSSVTAVMPSNNVPVDVGESSAPGEWPNGTASVGAAPVILTAPNTADAQVANTAGDTEPAASSTSKPASPAASPAEPAVRPSPSQQPTAVDSSASVDSSSLALFGSAWDSAPACSDMPTKETSVQDSVGRLWWFKNGVSCAYRNTEGKPVYYDGFETVTWDTAKTCNFTPTKANAMADAVGRAWGWMKVAGTVTGESCKFLQTDDTALPYSSIVAR